MLANSEKAEDFKEVTEAEKTALEATDATWHRPPQMFIDQWNEAAGDLGKYNEDTGYFELNGLSNITYQQALRIYKITYGRQMAEMSCQQFRTNLPFSIQQTSINMSGAFMYCTHTEVLNLGKGYYNNKEIILNTIARDIFHYCVSLREVIGVLKLPKTTGTSGLYNAFVACNNLEKIWLKGIYDTFEIKSSKLQIECFTYMINNAANINPIIIYVHPDIFAKITDEENEEWHSLLALAASKNIQFATT